jgi:hypothetical protein
MSTFQDVRGAMAKLTSEALVANGEPWGIAFADQSFDNAQETPSKDAAGAYAKINISFPQVLEETIGTDGVEAIIGSCNVLIYTPKGQGMKPAENAMQSVIKAWTAENAKRVPAAPAVGGKTVVSLRTRNINGPNALAPDERPHQVTQLSCAFTAIAQDPPTP